MLAATFNSMFDSICDSTANPYLTDTDKNNFARAATLGELEAIVRGLPENRYAVEPELRGLGNSQFEINDISILANHIATTASGADHSLSKTTLNTAIDAAAGISGAVVYHITAVTHEDANNNVFEAKFLRHNDRTAYERNKYLKASATRHYFSEFQNEYRFYPSSVPSRAVTLTSIRYPIEMLIDTDTPGNNVNPELPDHVMVAILYRACRLAGINIREPEFFQMVGQEYAYDKK